MFNFKNLNYIINNYRKIYINFYMIFLINYIKLKIIFEEQYIKYYKNINIIIIFNF